VASATAIGGVAVLTLGFASYVTGARINTSRSIPLGAVLDQQRTRREARLRDCLPAEGECN